MPAIASDHTMIEARTDPGHFFCFGLGYSATFLARELLALGSRVSGTCRDPEKRRRLLEFGFDAHLFDRDHPLREIDQLLAGATHVLSSVPPDELGDPVLDIHGEALAGASGASWVGYLSTTGVYGDRHGGWVDEDSALLPTGERGRRRVEAEGRWRALSRPAHIFRLAGIYGPGSSALDNVRAGRARRVIKPGQVFSRIHVGDIAQTLLASMRHPYPGRVYNLCDDDPAPPSDVIELACDLLGSAKPPEVKLEAAGLSPMARSFHDDNKRVSNARIKRELGIVLGYPSYRDGLAAILAAGF